MLLIWVFVDDRTSYFILFNCFISYHLSNDFLLFSKSCCAHQEFRRLGIEKFNEQSNIVLYIFCSIFKRIFDQYRKNFRHKFNVDIFIRNFTVTVQNSEKFVVFRNENIFKKTREKLEYLD